MLKPVLTQSSGADVDACLPEIFLQAGVFSVDHRYADTRQAQVLQTNGTDIRQAKVIQRTGRNRQISTNAGPANKGERSGKYQTGPRSASSNTGERSDNCKRSRSYKHRRKDRLDRRRLYNTGKSKGKYQTGLSHIFCPFQFMSCLKFRTSL